MRQLDRVEKALRLNEPIGLEVPRDNDKVLIIQVWSQEGFHLSPYQRKLFMADKVSSPDSITRYRRRFQERGQYKASPRVEEQRFKKFEEVRDRAVDKDQVELL